MRWGRRLDENVLASAVAEKGTWFRHVVTGIQERGALFGYTALTSGTCLMDEHIMILIINPYYDFRSVQFMYVSDSSHFPIPPTRQLGHMYMAVRYAFKKAPHPCTTSEYLINLPL